MQIGCSDRFANLLFREIELSQVARSADEEKAIPTCFVSWNLANFRYIDFLGQQMAALDAVYSGRIRQDPALSPIFELARESIDQIKSSMPFDTYDLEDLELRIHSATWRHSVSALAFGGNRSDAHTALAAFAVANCIADWKSEITRAWLVESGNAQLE